MSAAEVSPWVLNMCRCLPCRRERDERFLAALRASMRHPWELSLWPGMPFGWPTTQRAICPVPSVPDTTNHQEAPR